MTQQQKRSVLKLDIVENTSYRAASKLLYDTDSGVREVDQENLRVVQDQKLSMGVIPDT